MHCTRESEPLSLASVPALVGVFFHAPGERREPDSGILKTHKMKGHTKMIEIGDTVDYKTFYRCKVIDIRDGLLVIRPYCDATVTVRPSDVRLVKKAGQSNTKMIYKNTH